MTAAATSGVIIPNKSMIAEEEIRVPFGREGDDEGSFTDSRAGSPEDMARTSVNLNKSNSLNSSGGRPGGDIEEVPRSPDGRSPLERLGGQSFGLNALSRTLKSDDDDAYDDHDVGSAGSDGGRRGTGGDYFDKMSLGRASVQSDVSGKGARARQVRDMAFFTTSSVFVDHRVLFCVVDW